MLNFVASGHQEVIKVDRYETIKVASDGVHEPLESLGCIPESKRDAEELVQSKRRNDSGFGDVVCRHRNLMIATDQINLGEDAFPCQAGSKVLDVRDWVLVRRSDVVYLAVVSTGSPTAVRLGDDVERGGPRAVGAGDDAHGLHVVKIGLDCSEFVRRESPSPRVDRMTLGLDEELHAVSGPGVVERGFKEIREICQDWSVGSISDRDGAEVWSSRGRAAHGHRLIGFDVDKASVSDIHHEAVVTEEISSQKGVGNIGNEECPLKPL
jgi:hypothetical protein